MLLGIEDYKGDLYNGIRFLNSRRGVAGYINRSSGSALVFYKIYLFKVLSIFDLWSIQNLELSYFALILMSTRMKLSGSSAPSKAQLQAFGRYVVGVWSMLKGCRTIFWYIMFAII